MNVTHSASTNLNRPISSIHICHKHAVGVVGCGIISYAYYVHWSSHIPLLILSERSDGQWISKRFRADRRDAGIKSFRFLALPGRQRHFSFVAVVSGCSVSPESTPVNALFIIAMDHMHELGAGVSTNCIIVIALCILLQGIRMQ